MKRPAIILDYPKAIKALDMCVNDDGHTVQFVTWMGNICDVSLYPRRPKSASLG